MIGKKTIFTDKDIRYIKENYLQKTNRQIAAHLDKTLTVVRNKLYELGLARHKQKDRAWKPEEDQILISMYKTSGDVEIGLALKKKKGSIRKRRVTLGLIRTVDEIKAIVETNLEKFKETSFKKGNVPTPNPKKAWATRRQRDRMTTTQIVARIQKREKCNFYRK